MNRLTAENLGRVAYDAYYTFSEGKSLVSGAPLPAWDDQDPRIQAAWNFSATFAANEALNRSRVSRVPKIMKRNRDRK